MSNTSLNLINLGLRDYGDDSRTLTGIKYVKNSRSVPKRTTSPDMLCAKWFGDKSLIVSSFCDLLEVKCLMNFFVS